MTGYLREVGQEWNTITVVRRWPLVMDLSLVSAIAFRDDRPFIGSFVIFVGALKVAEMWFLERKLKAEVAVLLKRHSDGTPRATDGIDK